MDFYTLTTSIIKPTTYFGLSSFLGFDFGYTTLATKVTHFTVGTTTEYQNFIANVVGNIGQNGLGNLSATTTEAALASCNMISLHFNIGDCMTVLLYPNKSDMAQLFDLAKQGFFSKAPWGYVVRLSDILTNKVATTSSSTLPTFTVQFASSSPLASSPLTFDPQDMLTGGAALLNGITDPISGKSMKDITEPWVKLFIAISALIIIFNDIMGSGNETIRGGGKDGGGSSTGRAKYSGYTSSS
jgi:hypothetical protein